MQLRGVFGTGHAGRAACGCALLLALSVPQSALAQVYLGANASSILNPGSFALQEADTRDFAIVPMAGLQESFTDNVLLSPTNKEYDFITRPMVGAEAHSQGGPFVGQLDVHAFYDAYARESSLSGFSGDAQGNAAYTLIPAFLSIDAEGFLTNTYVTSFGVAADDRVGAANRVQVANYDIGPHMTTTVGDFADLDVVGRFAQIFFDNPSNSTAVIPTDSTIEQGSATLDTKKRFADFQFVTAGQYVRDDHGFEGYGGLQSAFVNITDDLRLIARGGYDAATETGVVDIHAPNWSGGLEYAINQDSKVSVERGERYNHAAWTALLHLQLYDRLFVDGNYNEVLQPDQIQIATGFADFVSQTTVLPPALANTTFTINNDLNGQVSLNKYATLRLGYDWQGDRVGLTASWNDQLFVATNMRNQSIAAMLDYGRNIAEDLQGTVTVAYWKTLANPLFGASELYSGSANLQYDVNTTMRAYLGYTYQHQAQLGVGGVSVTENVLFAAIAKRF
jgi:uncharacterized protein (PEP-CTERM system associated)